MYVCNVMQCNVMHACMHVLRILLNFPLIAMMSLYGFGISRTEPQVCEIGLLKKLPCGVKNPTDIFCFISRFDPVQ